MTLAARRGALPKNSGPVISEALERSAGGWVIQSVLSLLLERINRDAQQQKLRAHFVQAKQDVERLQEIKGEGEGFVRSSGSRPCKRSVRLPKRVRAWPTSVGTGSKDSNPAAGGPESGDGFRRVGRSQIVRTGTSIL